MVWLYCHGLPRCAALSAVLVVTLGLSVGFFVLAIHVVTTQASRLASKLPNYLHTINSHSSALES